jgi:type IV secretory pathway protease TraF
VFLEQGVFVIRNFILAPLAATVLLAGGCTTQTKVVVNNGELYPEATRALTLCLTSEPIYEIKRPNCQSSEIKKISPRAVAAADAEYADYIQNSPMLIRVIDAIEDQSVSRLNRLFGQGGDPKQRFSEKDLAGFGSEEKTGVLLDRAIPTLNTDIIRLLLGRGAVVDDIDPAVMDYVGVNTLASTKIGLMLINAGYVPSEKDLAKAFGPARKTTASDLDIFYFTLALNAAPKNVAAPFRVLYDTHLRYLVCAGEAGMPSACPSPPDAMTHAYLRQDAAKRQPGVQVCAAADSPDGNIFLLGFVDQISEDHLQIRLTHARLKSEPWSVVSDFRSKVIWDHIDHWYLAGPNSSCPDINA